MAQKAGTSKTVSRQLWDVYKFMFWAFARAIPLSASYTDHKGLIVAHCTGVMRMQWPMQGCSSAASIRTIDRREPVGFDSARRMQELS